MSSAYRSYGFVGLGAMGYSMAKNLRQRLPSSAEMYIYDIAEDIMQAFISECSDIGPITACRGSAEVVSKSACVISIVPEGKHVKAVFSFLTDRDTPVHSVAGKLFLECSTIDVATSREVAGLVSDAGAIFIDAPVSGGPAGAKNASLTFLMGMEDSHPQVNDVKAILSTMGKNLFACGGPTLGLVTKICNNYISGTIAVATSEGFNMAIRLGLNPSTFQKVLAVSTGGSWVNSNCNPVPGVDPAAPASNGYKPGFKVQFMLKDYKLALDAAKDVDAKLFLGPAGLNVYESAATDPKCVDLDSRVVYRYIGGKEDWVDHEEK